MLELLLRLYVHCLIGFILGFFCTPLWDLQLKNDDFSMASSSDPVMSILFFFLILRTRKLAENALQCPSTELEPSMASMEAPVSSQEGSCVMNSIHPNVPKYITCLCKRLHHMDIFRFCTPSVYSNKLSSDVASPMTSSKSSWPWVRDGLQFIILQKNGKAQFWEAKLSLWWKYTSGLLTE